MESAKQSSKYNKVLEDEPQTGKKYEKVEITEAEVEDVKSSKLEKRERDLSKAAKGKVNSK